MIEQHSLAYRYSSQLAVNSSPKVTASCEELRVARNTFSRVNCVKYYCSKILLTRSRKILIFTMKLRNSVIGKSQNLKKHCIIIYTFRFMFDWRFRNIFLGFGHGMSNLFSSGQSSFVPIILLTL